MPVTSANVTEYLDIAMGISMPSFVVSLACDKVNDYEASLSAAGYSTEDVSLVLLYSACIVACAGAPSQIQSQGAPSGASRSFKVSSNALGALRRSLNALDTAGVMSDVVGPDPAMGSLLLVV